MVFSFAGALPRPALVEGGAFNPWALSLSPGDPLPLQEEAGRGKSQEDSPDLGCSF